MVIKFKKKKEKKYVSFLKRSFEKTRERERERRITHYKHVHPETLSKHESRNKIHSPLR